VIAEVGHYALVLALGLALVQSSVPILGARRNDPVLMAVAGMTFSFDKGDHDIGHGYLRDPMKHGRVIALATD
jgi:cytochrome c biogenesis factor